MGFLKLMARGLFLVIILRSFISSEAANQPGFLTKGGSHEVLKGNNVQLDCVVENTGDDYAVLWKKLGNGSDDFSLIYAEEEMMMGSDDRFQLEHPSENVWNLTIVNVEAMDSGTYGCEITTHPPKIQRHILSVKVPPSVNIIPDTVPLVKEPGDDVSLTCHAAGNPKPKVIWRKIGGSLPHGAASLEGTSPQQLYIKEVRVEDAGEYICTASNNVGEPAKAIKPILVHSHGNQTSFPPWVEPAREYVAATVGETVNITCRYDAKPSPVVVWIFNTFPISFDVGEDKDRRRRYFSRKDEHTEATLVIKDTKEADFGDYTCRIENNMGSEEAKIHLSGFPAAAKIWSDSHDGVGTSVSLKWTIESAVPLIEYKIRYKSVDDDSWVQRLIPAENSENRGNIWSSAYVLEGLNPNTKYEIQTQGRNNYGWGSLPRHENFHFQTGEASSSDTASTSDTPSKKEEKEQDDSSPTTGAEKERDDSSPTTGAEGRTASAFILIGATSFCLFVYCYLLERR